MNACTVFGETRVKVADNSIGADDIKSALTEAANEAKRAADKDSHWQELAKALNDMTVADAASKDFSAASDRAWKVCAPYVGT